MTYDPFGRGPYPVGVRSGQIVDPQRGDRALDFEVWYPAGQEFAGRDLDPTQQDVFSLELESPQRLQQAAVREAAGAAGRYPLVLFSHTSAGHRRQSSFLCTHLASHGYVVAGVDHLGNTAMDYARRAAAGVVLSAEEREAYIRQIIADRVPDLLRLLDALLEGAAGDVAGQVDERRIGLVGWSFGGWAVLSALEVDQRPGAVVALVPGGSSNPLPGIIPCTLSFAWQREVPVLYLAAENDQYTPLPGQYELFERTPSANKQLFILRGADHLHFGDRIDEPGACPAEHAHAFTRGLSLAHFDAFLKANQAAQEFLQRHPAAV